MPGLLRHCSASIHEAISSIPIPVFQGGDLPGNLSRGDSGGDGLYQDYQGNRSAYGDYEFLHKALNADGDSYANGVRTRHGGSYRTDLTSAGERNAITDQDDLVRTAAIKRWYAGHQATAHSAREQLLNQYSHTHSNIPTAVADTDMPGRARGGESPLRTHRVAALHTSIHLVVADLRLVVCRPRVLTAAHPRSRIHMLRMRSSAHRKLGTRETTPPIQVAPLRAVPTSTPPATILGFRAAVSAVTYLVEVVVLLWAVAVAAVAEGGAAESECPPPRPQRSGAGGTAGPAQLRWDRGSPHPEHWKIHLARLRDPAAQPVGWA